MQGYLPVLLIGFIFQGILLLPGALARNRPIVPDVQVTTITTSNPGKPEDLEQSGIRVQAIDQSQKKNEALKESVYSANERLAFRLLGRDVMEILGLLRRTDSLDYSGEKVTFRNRSPLLISNGKDNRTTG